MSAGRVLVRLDDAGIVLTLDGYLGGARFAAYRDACAAGGARYDAAGRCNRAPLDAAPALLRSLREAGLDAAVDAALVAALEAKAGECRRLLDEGRARLQATGASLRERGLALFPYQRSGVEWLAPRDRALLADEMGLGKTVQALIALPAGAACLVVAPAAVEAVWVRECHRWRPDLAPARMPGRAAFRWPQAGELLVVSYGSLPEGALPPLPSAPVVVVADEAHALKNPKAKRTEAFRAVADAASAQGGRVWLLTGTPLLNRPPELWAVLQAAKLAPAAYGTWGEFCRLMSGRKGRFGYEWGRPLPEAADRLRRVSLQRRRTEVLRDLPTKTRQDLPCNGLSAETIAACDAALAALGLGAGEVPELAPGMPGFEAISRARGLLAAAKVPAMLAAVEEHEEQGEPLVVFCCHRAPVDVLAKRPGWAVITGDTPAEERGRIVDEFQAGRLLGVAGTTGAMGVGVTLTRAHRLLLVDLAWTPALNCQAEDRVCRIGQDRGVVVMRLVADHALDQRVVELLTAKQELIEAAVEASAVQEDYRGEPQADAYVAAVADAARVAVDLNVAEVRRQVEHEVVLERAKAEARERYGKDVPTDGRARGPATPAEEHAARALAQLAAMDPDRAGVENGVGFSKLDGSFGHSLADQLARRGMLSEKQWACAVKLANKYRRQVGTPEVRS